ncbi:hypothetical protein [Paenibacillus alvei]|uniref:hypothetical protein n=1 Tax=Paenibacillus alvei TaxID=44250 RepID=UPI0013DD0686|nr:hypothetical protein [Paenibacillus alvei]NEZ40737.1 hypothetical protein [Paenibacillus alvei]
MNESKLLNILPEIPEKAHADHGYLILRSDIIEAFQRHSNSPIEILDALLENLEKQGSIEILRVQQELVKDMFMSGVRLMKE